MNRRWICSDVWMDILPSFDRPQLGLKMALLSDRFDVLVDTHFDGKSELTIWRQIEICKEKIGLNAKLFEFIGSKSVEFPLPDYPLTNKIRFKRLLIKYIDHSVITFLRANKHIWDRWGINLELSIANVQPIWDAFARQIWPIFAANICHLEIFGDHHLDNLRRLISPTILTDLNQLNLIRSGALYPDAIADDGPNVTSPGQVLSKWLHTPTKNGKSKELLCQLCRDIAERNVDWVNSFKEKFICATITSRASYQITFNTRGVPTSIEEPFELVNKRTNEKLTLTNEGTAGIINWWILRRCPISGETAAAVQQQQQLKTEQLDNLNGVFFSFFFETCIGPLSPPDQSDEKVCSTPPAGPSSDQRND